MPQITPITIVGPTASGKSALGVKLAQEFGGEIINTDSMQCYRGMDIGTAKLPLAERGGIPHHLLDWLDVTETASVAEYQQLAVAKTADLLTRNVTPVHVGGSMMYVQSLVDAWEFPPTDAGLREKLQQELAEHGLKWMQQQLQQVDPEAAKIIEANDGRRIVRALEVVQLTGQPFAASQPPKDAPTRWNTLLLGLKTTPEWLNPRIELRTKLMLEQGLIAETEQLVANGLTRQSTAGRAIGYAQALAYLAGEITLEQVYEQTVFATRRYVRRQRSWFKRDSRIIWLDATGDVLDQAQSAISTHFAVTKPAASN